MGIGMSCYYFLKDPEIKELGTTPEQFLLNLPGPTVIDITGSEDKHPIVICTLIHANEPSGFTALYHLLKRGFKPKTPLRFVLPSVKAAQQMPLFSQRFYNGEIDLNRCFAPDKENNRLELASDTLTHINECSPQYILDLHNTSGASPAFAVSVSNEPVYKQLAAFFCNQMIVTDIRIGALMEQNLEAPVITIECGGASDIASTKRAELGIRLLSNSDQDDLKHSHEIVDIFRNPYRIQLQQHQSLCYASHFSEEMDITLVRDIERRNFGLTHQGTCIGWTKSKKIHHIFHKQGLAQHETNIDLDFEIKDHQILTKRDLYFFMATDNLRIASKDCLFYIIEN